MPDQPTDQTQFMSTLTTPGPKRQVINLTEQLVVEEADAMLAICPDYPYRQIFALASERQRLIRYVLNRVNKVYLLVQRPHLVQRQYESVVTQKTAIRKALREGIQAIAEVYLRSSGPLNPLDTNYSVPSLPSESQPVSVN